MYRGPGDRMTQLAMEALGLAASRGDLAALRAVRAAGGDVLGPTDPDELTTLHWACGGGHPDVVLWLLRVCRADPHAPRRNRFRPIHTAAMQGHASVVRLLLAAGADPDVQTHPEGYAPMHSAAWAGHVETVEVLLTVGADRSLRNHRGETPAQTAARQGQDAVVRLFAERGAPAAGPRIAEIAWGRIALDSGAAFRDVKIWPGGAREWDWRETGTRHVPGIQAADVRELLDRGCDVVILSRGQNLVLQTAPEVLDRLRAAGIEVLHLESREAVARYNALVAAGRRVGALIHSTC